MHFEEDFGSFWAMQNLLMSIAITGERAGERQILVQFLVRKQRTLLCGMG